MTKQPFREIGVRPHRDVIVLMNEVGKMIAVLIWRWCTSLRIRRHWAEWHVNSAKISTVSAMCRQGVPWEPCSQDHPRCQDRCPRGIERAEQAFGANPYPARRNEHFREIPQQGRRSNPYLSSRRSYPTAPDLFLVRRLLGT